MLATFTWSATAVSNDWNNANNWTGGPAGEIPDDAADIAVFSDTGNNGFRAINLGTTISSVGTIQVTNTGGNAYSFSNGTWNALNQLDLSTTIGSGSNYFTNTLAINDGAAGLVINANDGSGTNRQYVFQDGAGFTIDVGLTKNGADEVIVRRVIGAAGGMTLNAGTFTYDRGAATTLSNGISGAGVFIKAGGGQLILAGDSSAHTGQFRFNGGTTTVDAATDLGSGLLQFNSGTLQTTVSLNLANSISLNSGQGVFNVAQNTTVDLQGVVSSANDNIGLVKDNAGTLILSNNNTYNSWTEVRAGMLVVAHDNALGSTAGRTVVAQYGTLGFQNNVTVAETLVVNGSGGGFFAGALRSIAGANVVSGDIILGSNTSIVSATGTLTINGTIEADYEVLFEGTGDIVVNGDITGAVGFVEGLREGRLHSGLDTSRANPGGSVQLTPRLGYLSTTPSSAGSFGFWGENDTWVYTGQIFDADGTFTFAENIDDQVIVIINGTIINGGANTGSTILRSGGTDQHKTVSVSSTTIALDPDANGSEAAGMYYRAGGTSSPLTTPLVDPDGDQWYTIEIRFGNGGGGGGANNFAAMNWSTTFGFGYLDSILLPAGPLTANTLASPADPVFNRNSYGVLAETASGGATLLRTAVNNSVRKAGTGTLTLNGAKSFEGDFTIDRGAVIVNSDGALGSTTGSTTVKLGGTLVLNNLSYAATEPLILDGGALSAVGASSFAGNISGQPMTNLNILVAGAGDALLLSGDINLGGGVIEFEGAGQVQATGVISSGTTPVDSLSLKVYSGSFIPGLTVGSSPNQYISLLNATPDASDDVDRIGGESHQHIVTVDMTTPLDFGAGTTTVGSPGLGTPLDRGAVANPDNMLAGIGVTGIGADNVTLIADGWLRIDTAGSYTFSTLSDDGANIWLDLNDDGDFGDAGELVTPITSNQTGAGLETGPAVVLAAGYYRFRTGFYEVGGSARWQVQWDPPGATTRQVIPISQFSRNTFANNVVVNMSGAGSVTFGGASPNTYDGTTTVLAGTLVVAKDAALGSTVGGTTVNAGGTLLLDNVAYAATEAVTLAGGTLAGNGTSSFAGTINVTATSSITATGTLVLNGAISGALGNDLLQTGGLVVLNNDNVGFLGTYVVQTGATLAGDGGVGGNLTVQGGGTLAPSDATGAAGTTGSFTVGGNLLMQDESILSIDITSTVAFDQVLVGGTVDITGADLVGTSPAIVNGSSFTIIDNSLADLVAGTFDQGATATFSGRDYSIAYNDGDNDVVLTKVATSRIWDGGGANDLWTNAVNWVGDIAPDAGDILIFGELGALRKATNNNDFAAGTVFESILFVDGGYTLSGNAIGINAELSSSVGTNIVALAGIALTSTILVNVAAGTLTVSSPVSGSGGKTKTGAGTLVLSGTNSYSGATNINGGAVQVAASANLGDASATNFITFDGGTLITTATFANARGITLNAGGGTIQVNAGTLTQSGVVSGPGSLTKTAAGTLALTGVNTYSGVTNINGGIVAINSGASLGDGSAGNDITFNNGQLNVGLTAGVTTNRDIDLVGNATINMTTAQTLGLSGVISGGGNLTTTATLGGAVIQLSNTNTFTGQWTIARSVSQLLTGGTVSDTSGIVVASLAGQTGRLILSNADTYSLTAGTLSLATGANSIGQLWQTTGNVTVSTIIDGGATTEFELRNGSMTVASGLSVDTLWVANTGATSTASLTVQGGAVRVGTGAEIMYVGRNPSSGSTVVGSANFSAAASVDIDVVELQVGFLSVASTAGSAVEGDLLLSNTTNTVRADLIDVANSPFPANNTRTSSIVLGNGINDFFVDTMFVGHRKSTGLVTMSGAGTWSLVGNNVAETDLYIGINDPSSGVTNIPTNGTISLANGTFNATLDDLWIGYFEQAFDIGSGATSNAQAIGTLTYGTGTVTAGTVQMAYGNINDTTSPGSFAWNGTSGVGTAGTLNIGGGSFAADIVTMGRRLGNMTGGAAAVNATINLDGGTFTAIELYVGDTSVGNSNVNARFDNDGGTVNLGNLIIGVGGTAATVNGVFDQSAGDTIVSSTTQIALTLGTGNASGTLTLTGGTFTSDLLVVGTEAIPATTTTATVNQTDATVRLTTLAVGSAGVAADYNWNSGTIGNRTGTNLINTNVTIDVLGAGTHTIDISAGQTGLFQAASLLRDTGSITKTGGGDLILAAANTYSGLTNINGGSVQIASSANLGDNSGTNNLTFDGGTLITTASLVDTRTITLNAGGGVLSTTGGTLTQTGTISGVGGLTKAGPGTLVIGGASPNTYAGTTTVTAGILAVEKEAALGTTAGGTTVQAGATLQLSNVNYTTTEALTLSGATLSGTGTSTWSGTVNVTAPSTFTTTGTTIVNGAISGAAGNNLVQTAGTFVLNNNNAAFIGSYTVQSGATLAGDGGVGGDLTVSTGATLAPSDAAGTAGTVGSFTVGGNLLMQNDAVLSIDIASAASFDQIIALGTVNIAGASLVGTSGFVPKGSLLTIVDNNLADPVGGTFDQGAAVTFSSRDYTVNYAGGTGNDIVLGKVATTRTWDGGGANDLWTNGVNWVGDVAPDEGDILVFGAVGAVRKTTNTNDFTAGTSFESIAFVDAGYTLSGNAIALELALTHNSGTNTVALAGIAIASVLPITVTAGTLTISSPISGAGGLTKLGAGTLILSGASSYVGLTSIMAGVVQVSAANNLGDGGATNDVAITNATLQATAGFTTSRTLAITGTGTIQVDAGTLSWGGVISGGALTKTGAGTLALTAANTYSGVTSINGGVVQVAASNNLGNAAGSNSLAFDGGTLQATTGFATGRAVLLNAGGGTIQVDAGTQTLSGVISGTGSLTKTGAATLILSNAGNTYSGLTNINAGFLQVAASGNLGNNSATNNITFDGGTLITTASFTNARSVLLNAGGGTYQVNTGPLNQTGVVSGSGNLTKTGGGTLALQAANTYSGLTNVNAGFLTVTTAANLGDESATNDITFNGGQLNVGGSFATSRDVQMIGTGTINMTGAFTLTLNGVISDSGALTAASASNTSIIELTNTNTMTGQLTVARGIVALLGGTVSDTSNIVVGTVAGQQGQLRVVTAGTYDLTQGALTLGVAGTGFYRQWLGDVSVSTVLDGGAASTLDVENGSLTIASGLTVDSFGAGNVLENIGVATAVGSVTVQGGDVNIGTGTQTMLVGRSNQAISITGNADFSAASSVTINVATLRVGHANTGSAISAEGNLTLATTGTNTVTANVMIVGDSDGPGNNNVTSDVTLGDASNIFNVNTLIVGRRKSNGAITMNGAGDWQLNGQGGAATTANLIIGRNDVNGVTNTVALGNVSLAFGTFNANLGDLWIGRFDQTYNVNGSSSNGIGDGTLEYATGTVNALSVQIGYGAIIDNTAGGGALNWTGRPAPNGVGARGTLTIGGGTFTADTVQLGQRTGDNAGGNARIEGTINLDGGTFTATDLFIGFDTLSTSPVVGRFDNDGGTVLVTNMVIGRNTNTNVNGLVSGTFDQSAGDTTVTGTVTLGLTTSTGNASGTLTLTGGTFTADTLLLASETVAATTTAAVVNQTNAIVRLTTLSTGTPGSADVDYNWNSGTLTNVPGTGFTNTNVTIDVDTLAVHTLEVETGQTATFQAASLLQGAGSITKTGDGLLLMQGGHTFAGGLDITQGDLQVTNVAGSASGTGTLQIQTGTTLFGTGRVGTTIIRTGGTLSPAVAAGAVGTLTVAGDLTMDDESILVIDITGVATADQVVVLGIVTVNGADISGTSVVNPPIGTTYVIVDNDNADGILGTGFDATVVLLSGRAYQVSLVGGTGNDVTLTKQATTRTWTGGDAVTNNWTDDDNWGGQAPDEGDVLVFGDVAAVRKLTNFNDFAAGTFFSSIFFVDGGYQLNGNALVVNFGVTQSVGDNSINLAGITTGAAVAQTWSIQAGTLTVVAPVTLGNDLQIAGPGDINLGAITGAFNLTTTGSGVVAFDGTTSVATIQTSLNGSTEIGANLTTTGTQTYQNGVTLTADVNLTGTTITFQQPVIGGTNDLTITGDADFNAAVTGVDVLLVTGATSLDGGVVTTTGTQTYTGAVTQSVDNVLTGSLVAFLSTVDGGTDDLSIVGDADFNAAATNLEDLSVSGTTNLDGGIVTSTGTQTYTGAVTQGAANVLTGSLVTFGSTVDGGAFDLTITGNADFNGAATNLEDLSVSGTTSLDGGVVTSTGTQTYTGAVTQSVDNNLTGSLVTFGSTVDGGTQDLTITGDADFNGAATNLEDLLVTGATSLDGGVITSSLTQTYTGAVTQSVDNVLTGSLITFLSTVDGGGQDLTITGNADFNGAATNLEDLSVSGTTNLDGGVVTSTGTQTYTGAVTQGVANVLTGSLVTFGSTVDGGAFDLTVTGNADFNGAATNLEDLSVSGTTSLDGGVVTSTGTQTYTGAVTQSVDNVLTGSLVTFGSTVDGGAQDLSIVGNADFNGAATNLEDLSVSGTTSLDGGVVTSTGTQTYTGAVTQSVDNVLTGSLVTFGSTVDGGAQDLSIVGNADFNGAATNLADLLVTGATSLDGGVVTSTGTQTYTGPVTQSVDNVLTGSLVTFLNTVNGGAQDLSIVGNADFNGAATNLEDLLVTGTTNLDGGVVTSTGTQTYAGPVTQSVANTLTGSLVTFQSTFAGGGLDLTILGNADLNGAATGLDDLVVTGATSLDGGVVTSAGNQTYVGPVSQSVSNTLTGNLITLGNTLTGGGQNLAVVGNVDFNGAATGLANLAITGTTNLDGGVITSTGTQTFGGAAVLGANNTLTGSQVTFNDDLTIGGFNLTVVSGTPLLLNQGGADSTTLLSGGTLTANNGIVVGEDGDFTGHGQIAIGNAGAAMTVNGQLSPGGDDIGQFAFSGAGATLAFTAGSQYNLDIFGTDPGEFDSVTGLNRMNVDGQAQLFLNLLPSVNFPTEGDLFQIVDSNFQTNGRFRIIDVQFDNFELPQRNNGQVVSVSYLFNEPVFGILGLELSYENGLAIQVTSPVNLVNLEPSAIPFVIFNIPVPQQVPVQSLSRILAAIEFEDFGGGAFDLSQLKLIVSIDEVQGMKSDEVVRSLLEGEADSSAVAASQLTEVLRQALAKARPGFYRIMIQVLRPDANGKTKPMKLWLQLTLDNQERIVEGLIGKVNSLAKLVEFLRQLEREESSGGRSSLQDVMQYIPAGALPGMHVASTLLSPARYVWDSLLVAPSSPETLDIEPELTVPAAERSSFFEPQSIDVDEGIDWEGAFSMESATAAEAFAIPALMALFASRRTAKPVRDEDYEDEIERLFASRN